MSVKWEASREVVKFKILEGLGKKSNFCIPRRAGAQVARSARSLVWCDL